MITLSVSEVPARHVTPVMRGIEAVTAEARKSRPRIERDHLFRHR